MKKIMFTLFAAFVLSNVNAQENVIKVNPLGLLFGSAEFSYERALNEKSSAELSVAYINLNANFSNGEDAGVSGLGVEGKYKFYFSKSKDAPRGWYAAPVASYFSISGKAGNNDGKVSAVTAGAIAGYQWVFGRSATGFALDLNFGAQYLSAQTSGDINGLTIGGILPRLGLAIGYAW